MGISVKCETMYSIKLPDVELQSLIVPQQLPMLLMDQPRWTSLQS